MEKLSERRTECVSLRENSVWRSVCTIQSERSRNADENGKDLPLGVKSSLQALLHGWWPTINGFSWGSYWIAEADDWAVAPWRFPLTQVLTNDPDVLATIPEQERSPRFLELSEDKLPTDRTWGVIWDAKEDMLWFTGLKGDLGTTRRKILSQAFSVWDPRGLLLPFTMKYGWDDELKEADLQEWRE